MSKKEITKEELLQILQLGKSKKDTAEQLGVCTHTLNKLIRFYKVEENYTYNRLTDVKNVICDVTYFDNIKSEEQAYIFGFILADGWITKTGKYLGIAVQERDIGILQKIQKAIKHTGNLRHLTTSLGSKQVELRIGSRYMVNTLKSLGITTNKSFDASIPDSISRELIPHVLRGLFDGNGSFRAKTPLLCTSSIALRSFVIDYCKKEYGYVPSNYDQVSKSGVVCYRLALTKALSPLIDKMYSNCSIVLDRKYDSYLTRRNKSTEVKDKKP